MKPGLETDQSISGLSRQIVITRSIIYDDMGLIRDELFVKLYRHLVALNLFKQGKGIVLLR